MTLRMFCRLAAITVGAIACRHTPPVGETTLTPPAPGGMPTLERRVLTLADSDLAEGQYWPMGVNESGNVVFLASSSEQPMFRIVDSTGRRLGAFGRLGDGPGEFRGPLDLQLRGDSIRIFDAMRMFLVQYSTAGKPIKDTRALMLDIPLAWTGDSVDHWMPPGLGPTKLPLIRRSLVGDSSGRVVIPANDSGFVAILASPPGGKRLMLLPYAAGPNRIYLADAYHYQIFSYDASGKLLATFGRQLPPHHRGPRELAEARAGLIRAGKYMMGPKGEKISLPDQSKRLDTLEREITPHFDRAPLHVDGFGRLWVVGVTNDSTTVDVFADTTLLGRVVLPCYLGRRGIPVALTGQWLLLECGLPEAADLASELQLYRIVEAKRVLP